MPVVSASSPSWDSAHRAGGDAPDRDKTFANLLGSGCGEQQEPGAVSCKLKHSSLWLIVPFTEVIT